MDPTKLRHFLAVLETCHFGRAAKATGVSQQAVSKSIARLEEMLDVQLFHRVPQGATPTEFALALAERARLIVAEAKLATAEVAALKGARRGNIRIGIGIGFANRIMPVALSRFRKRYPGFGVEAVVGSTPGLYPLLLRGDVDFVVSAPYQNFDADPDLRRELLFQEEDTVVVRSDHPLASHSSVTYAEIARYPWIASQQLTEMWSRICAAFIANGTEPPMEVVRTDSTILAVSLLLQGDYVGLMDSENISNQVAAGHCRYLDFPDLRSRREAYLAYRRRSPLSVGARHLTDLVREVCLELRPPG